MDKSIFFSLKNGINFKSKKYEKERNIFQGTTSHDLDKKNIKTLHFFKTNNKKEEIIKQETIEEKNIDEENKDENDENGDYLEENDENNENDNNNNNDKDEGDENNNDDDLFKVFNKQEKLDIEDDDNSNKKNKKPISKEEKHKLEINRIRKINRIKVEGTDLPDPITDFSQLSTKYKVKKYLSRNISELNYKEPSPIQMQTIPILLEEREVIGIAPTGSGKTAAFTIPILQALKLPAKDGFRAVVIAPTRELAQQIYRNFKLFSKSKPFRICVLSKNIHQKNDEKIVKNFDILITTPLRLVYLIKESNIALNRTEYLVFDEADKLFDKDFLEQVDDVVNACQNPKLKICLFSATMNSVVESTAKTIMKNPVKVVIGEENAASETINQHLIFVGKEEGKLLAIRQLFQKGMEPPVLIFVQSKERAQELFQELIFDGINVDVIHSDRTQFQRDTIVKKFRTGKIWVLICTELMARGMDFKGVNFVINFDFPQSLASYVHRIGRTGRAGKPGTAYTLYTEADAPMIPTIAHAMKQSGSEVPEWMQSLKSSGKQKYDYKKKGVNRESISTIPKNERVKLKSKKRVYGDISKKESNNNNTTTPSSSTSTNNNYKSSNGQSNIKKLKFNHQNSAPKPTTTSKDKKK